MNRRQLQKRLLSESAAVGARGCSWVLAGARGKLKQTMMRWRPGHDGTRSHALDTRRRGPRSTCLSRGEPEAQRFFLSRLLKMRRGQSILTRGPQVRGLAQMRALSANRSA